MWSITYSDSGNLSQRQKRREIIHYKMVLEFLTLLGEELIPKLKKGHRPGQPWEPSRDSQVSSLGCGCQKHSASVILVPASPGQLLHLSAMDREVASDSTDLPRVIPKKGKVL